MERPAWALRSGGNDNFYPYGKAASGAGWSYDGNQTITLNGISLSGKNADVFQLCNPDRNLTVVIAAGSVNTMGSLETIYKMGSTKHVTLTFTGTGTINCTRGLQFRFGRCDLQRPDRQL